VKLYLKLLACLQGCLEGDGVFPLLEELFSRAADLQTASSDDVSIYRELRYFFLGHVY
jgi:nuclear cap-binding protein subunit 1